MLVAFRIRRPAYLCVRISLVIGGCLFTEGLPFCAALFSEFDALDTAPAVTAFGQYLAHFFDRVVGTAVVAVCSFRHQFFLSESGTLLGMVGLFVRPRDSEQPAARVAT